MTRFEALSQRETLNALASLTPVAYRRLGSYSLDKCVMLSMLFPRNILLGFFVYFGF